LIRLRPLRYKFKSGSSYSAAPLLDTDIWAIPRFQLRYIELFSFPYGRSLAQSLLYETTFSILFSTIYS